MASESSMWRRLKDGADRLDFALERHENLVGVGAPDVWGYGRGTGSFWLELKHSALPKRLTSKPECKLRPSQRIWFRKMTKLDCRTHWVFMQIGTELYLIPGYLSDGLADWMVADYESFCVSSLTPTELVQKAAKGF